MKNGNVKRHKEKKREKDRDAICRLCFTNQQRSVELNVYTTVFFFSLCVCEAAQLTENVVKSSSKSHFYKAQFDKSPVLVFFSFVFIIDSFLPHRTHCLLYTSHILGSQ